MKNICNFQALKIAAAVAIGFALVSTAQAAQFSAGSSGWITDANKNNSSGFNGGIHNTYAGWGYGYNQYNDWFNVTLPNYAITSATLYIWSDRNNPVPTLDPSAYYSLHQASSFTFSGLESGSALGSTTLADANKGVGQYVGITLNSAGLSALNASLGGQFNFGGTITTAYSNPSSTSYQIAAWGWTDGSPVAYLDVNAVPEPSQYALMATGLGLMGFMVRRNLFPHSAQLGILPA